MEHRQPIHFARAELEAGSDVLTDERADFTKQVNNVFNNPRQRGGERWIAYPHPQVIFQYFDGLTGELKYAEAISTCRAIEPPAP